MIVAKLTLLLLRHSSWSKAAFRNLRKTSAVAG